MWLCARGVGVGGRQGGDLLAFAAASWLTLALALAAFDSYGLYACNKSSVFGTTVRQCFAYDQSNDDETITKLVAGFAFAIIGLILSIVTTSMTSHSWRRISRGAGSGAARSSAIISWIAAFLFMIGFALVADARESLAKYITYDYGAGFICYVVCFLGSIIAGVFAFLFSKDIKTPLTTPGASVTMAAAPAAPVMMVAAPMAVAAAPVAAPTMVVKQ